MQEYIFTLLPIHLTYPSSNLFIYTLDIIGLFGPIILFLVNIWQLWGNGIYWTANLVIFGINLFINNILKLWIKQPRPVGGHDMFNYKDPTGIDQYGMPSTHLQTVVCSLIFLYLVKQSSMLLISGMFITTLTIYQRFKYRKHTLEQLSVGGLIGLLVAFFGYIITTMIITEQI